MLLDCEQRLDGWFQNFDVCICGAGPAGVTLARRLAAKGHRVALFEAGDLEPSATSQELYQGDIVGLPYTSLDQARIRCFGGSSNHWGGHCRELDAHDFDALAHRPLGGWPIKKSDLDSYSAATDAILELTDHRLATEILGLQGQEAATAPYKTSNVNFAIRYRAELAKSEAITLFYNANLVDIELQPNLQQVSSAVFRSYLRDGTFSVSCRHFVLCLGGIENPRALLNADRQIHGGIGNQHDVVGRYFCEHPGGRISHAIMSDPPTEPLTYIAPSRLLSERHCLSFQVGLDPVWEHASRLRKYSDTLLCSASLMQSIGKFLLRRDVICYDAVAGFMIEQSLNADSRVKLTDKTDRFGLRQVALDWRLTELDWHTIRTAALELGRVLATRNTGRLQILPWLVEPNGRPPHDELWQVYHHMCTTRMSVDPKVGVVDGNCRVHGMENLYIGGSSVFASAGLSNPTYTIVQLALRLGDHLDTKLR